MRRAARVVLLVCVVAFGVSGQAVLLAGQSSGRWFAQMTFLGAPDRIWLAGNSASVGLALYGLAVVLFTVLLIILGKPPVEEPTGGRRPAEMALLVGILLLACGLRLYRWDEVPPGVHVDEAINGLNALGILVRGHNTIFFENSDGREILMPYLLALSFRFLGVDLFAFKIVPLFLGLLTVAAVYALGVELFTREVGLLAAFLAAVSKWDLVISRVTHEAAPVPLLAAAVVLFFVRALRTRHIREYLACGVALGVGMYTYPAFRAMPVLLAVYAVGRAVLERGFLLRHILGLVSAAGAALMVFAPFGRYMLEHWAMFTQRMRVTSFYADPHYSGDVPGTLWANFLKSLSLFFSDNVAVYYLPGDAVLDLVSAVFLVLGVWYCLWFWSERQNGLLLVWFTVGLFPSVLSHAVRLPHALRAAALIPLAPLLAAVGLMVVWRAVPAQPKLRVAATACVAGLIAILNLNTYFVSYAQSAGVYNAFDPVPSAVGHAVNSLVDRYEVLVTPLVAEHSSFRLLTYGNTRYRRLEVTNAVGVTGALQKDVACVLSPFDVTRYPGYVNRLRQDYPGGTLTEYTSPYGGLLYSVYLIPKEEVKAALPTASGGDWGGADAAMPMVYSLPGPLHGLVGWYYQDYAEGPMWLGAPRTVRIDQVIGPGDWVTANFPFSVIWRGQVEVPGAGEYGFGAQSAGAAWVYIDGRLVTDDGIWHDAHYSEGSVMLAQGFHEIEVRYAFERGRPQLVLYWTQPGGSREVLPASALHPIVALAGIKEPSADLPR